MQRLSRIDRRLGARIRRAVAGVPGGPPAAEALASGLSPAFRLVVAGLVARRAHRASGLRALAAGVGAATAARLLRDRLGRRRPGPRAEGGFPSRHAAAATAIAVTVIGRERGLGRLLLGAAALGGVARVATAEHEPADIVAGAALGILASGAVRRIAGSVGPQSYANR